MKRALRLTQIAGVIQTIRSLMAAWRNEAIFNPQNHLVEYAKKKAYQTFGLPDDWEYSETELQRRARPVFAANSGHDLQEVWWSLLWLVDYHYDPETLLAQERWYIEIERPEVWKRFLEGRWRTEPALPPPKTRATRNPEGRNFRNGE